ncbi:uncharacterized protein PV09_04448 [Verruconis gallopava]|uniref:Ribosomal protein S35, mitochondrial n=1 Tax=Verruconis gallopava TaxID=253628 RepID=A0A0D2AE25_9PEZI|nr:uncharacterized protein PV09_04448 [Verruconis gallopava]KIW04715.1 hypothetical protein PV09_04448 [Verruconis gallopava]
MSRRQLLQSASSIGSSILASSQSCRRSTCIFQQIRGIKYESFEERRQAAKEWAATEGRRYMRPRRGQTNYLSFRRGEEDDVSPSAGEQSGDGFGQEAEASDPWEDAAAVEKLKQEHDLSDEAIQAYRQKHEGLTPSILAESLADGLSDVEISEAISRHAAARFDADEASRVEAGRLLAKNQTANAKPERRPNLRPFPNNTAFMSQPVLSEELREMIYLKVVRDQMTVRTVSTLFGVSMERVGAVVRMKQMERDWVKKGKPLAVPYSRAVLDMLPQTPFIDPTDPKNISPSTGKPRPQPPHEPLNEIPVHPATTHQTFVSVPESRTFTREDAAKAFHPNLKSPDERIPHPELLAIEKFRLHGAKNSELQAFTRDIIEKEKQELAARARREAAKEKATTKVYEGRRWQFKIQDISVEDAGRDGRDPRGVGWRYGVPHDDRKRGTVKIPTSVS